MFNEDMWKKVESESPTGERIAARLVMPEVSKRIYAGFDANKKRHLLISLNPDDEEYHDLLSKGFSIATKELIVKGSEAKRYIDLVCHDESGHIIFNFVGNEITERLSKKDNVKEIIEEVINKWRNFWGKPLREFLSYNELIGLFAELWFLYHWMLPKMDKLESVNKWRGPLGSRHDFEWTGKSVEVKATTNVQSRIHKIHGLDQLSPPVEGQLFLFSLRLREEQGAENTLPRIISLCREILKEDLDALSKFENTLVVAGYSPQYDHEYSRFRFRIVDERLYKVNEEFPRLIKESFVEGLPLGIGMIEYSINLDGYDYLSVAKSPDEVDILG